MFATQVEVENDFSKKNLRKIIEQTVNRDHPITQQMVQLVQAYRLGNYYQSKQKRIEQLTMSSEDIVLAILVSIFPVQEISPMQAVATELGQRLGFSNLLDGVKTASELLAICTKADAYDIYHSQDSENDTGTIGIRCNYALEPHTAHQINKLKYLPPMLIPPRKWLSNRDGGYLEGSGSIILGYLNHHDKHQARDVINILQSIEWSLNDMVDYQEKPKKPLNTPEKAMQFKQLIEESLVVYEDLINHGNRFYFVWKYDKRGRMYSQGYHCNLQSTEYKKAILEFTKEEIIK